MIIIKKNWKLNKQKEITFEEASNDFKKYGISGTWLNYKLLNHETVTDGDFEYTIKIGGFND